MIFLKDTNIRSALKSRQRGFLLNPHRFGAPAAIPSEQYYAKNAALIHFEGANGSTTVTDNSPVPKTCTVRGASTISTAWSMFGTGSLAIPNTTSGLTIAHHTDFNLGTSDFTIELAVRFSSLAGDAHVVSKYPSPTTVGPFTFYRSGTVLAFYASSNATSWNVVSALAMGTGLVINTTYRFAVVRCGNIFYTFKDGVYQNTVSSALALADNTGDVTLGWSPTSVAGASGYIDEFRWTKHVSRYPAAYTPAIAAFEDASSVTTDPVFSLVQFLIRGETSYGEIAKGRAVGVGGGTIPIRSITQKLFEAASIRFSGSSELTIPASADFNMAYLYWTLEGFVWFDSFASSPYIFNIKSSTDGKRVAVQIDTTGHLVLYVQQVSAVGGSSIVSTNAIAVSGWYHFAIVKNGASNYKLFLAGVKGYDGTSAQSPASDTYGVTIGSAQPSVATAYWTGYGENLRFTTSNSDVAAVRYLADFAPATENFPLS